MFKQYEDPNRTDPPEDDCFDKFIGDITGRDPDNFDFYEKRPILPYPTEEDIAEKKIKDDAHREEINAIVKGYIHQYCKTPEDIAIMYKRNGFEVES